LCERLIETGAEVVGVDNLSTGQLSNLAGIATNPLFRFVTRDVTEPVVLTRPIDFVFHLASPAAPRDYLRLPLETLAAGSHGTLHALQLAQSSQARFLMASTSEVYGDPLEHPQHESHWGNVNPIGPRSVYDEAKRYAEALTAAWQRAGRVSTVIARIFNTYGPRMRPGDGRMVPAFIAQAMSGIPLSVAGDGSQTRSLSYVDDTVAGLMAAASSPHAGPFNIGNPFETTVLEVAETIRHLCGSISPIEFIDLPVDDLKRRRPDIAAARSLLSWEPRTTLIEGLAQTVDWTRNNVASAVPKRLEGVR
jgi:dTDP-glucose 4,6-dehydratase